MDGLRDQLPLWSPQSEYFARGYGIPALTRPADFASKVEAMAVSDWCFIGSTRVPRVQFGVSPNCIGKRTMQMTWMNNGKL